MSKSRRSTLQYTASKRFRAAALAAAGRIKTLQAQLARKRFYCRALSGQSCYNLCVNADMTVSCNCNDVYGRGRIGKLGPASFREVLDGPVANAFRRRLAQGKLAIPECAACPELILASKDEAQAQAEHHALPRAIMLETNGGCNLACLGCERSERKLTRVKMPLADVERVATELAAMQVQAVSLFSLGEPFLSDSILDEVECLVRHIPGVAIWASTNGVRLNNERKRRAALQMDCIYFSLDGCDQRTAERYQRGTDFAAAFANMCELAKAKRQSGAKTKLIWKYVLFNWNDRRCHIDRALDLARQADVDTLAFVPTKTPFYGISWRYLLDPRWRRLGEIRDGYRCVDRPEGPADPSSAAEVPSPSGADVILSEAKDLRCLGDPSLRSG